MHRSMLLRLGLAAVGSWLLVAACGAAEDHASALEAIRAERCGGVCVQLGCGDGALTAELAESGNLLVHALEADANLVAKAREGLSARKLYGQASVEQWSSSSLPYADNLVNIVVVGAPGRVSESEILRVLAPNGKAWLKSRDGQWKVLRKARPKEFDEWTHRRHAAESTMTSRDTAVSVPTGIRWLAGPAQDAGGKKWYYDHLCLSSGGRNFYVFDETIAARDAFNGRLLWTAAVKTPVIKEVSVGGPRTSKVCPVATATRLYCVAGSAGQAGSGALVALDTETGEQRETLASVEAPREILRADGILLVSDKTALHAYGEGNKPLWAWQASVKRMVAGSHRVFCVSSSRVTSLELASGKERWHVEEPKAVRAETCSYGEEVLVLERSTWKDAGAGAGAGDGVVVLSGDDGELLWAKDYKPGMTHYQEPRAFFADGLLWLQLAKGKVGGFDPKSGKQRKEWTSNGGHCAAPVATERFLIAPEIEFTDFETGQRSRARMMRSACRNAFVPANGLLYTFPVQCECFPMLRGYIALDNKAALPQMSLSYPPEEKAGAPAVASGARPPLASGGTTAAGKRGNTPALAADHAGRLSKGPAYGAAAAAPGKAAADEWPMYRHDCVRSGATSAAVASGAFAQLWQTPLVAPRQGLVAADWKDNPYAKGLVTAPVAAGGNVLVAVPDEHLLVALDGTTGARRWSFTAGGRIDTPPSVCEGLCVFGAHDGCVYCVTLAAGDLVWKFRAAPLERRIMAYGQMESPWPVAGSVLVDSGVAYFAAGRHPASDGGVFVWALQVRDARVLWQRTVTDTGMKSWYGPTLPRPNNKIKVGVDYEPVDMFVKDGDCVAMSRWRFKPDNGEFTLDVANLQYEPFPGLSVPRGLWSYGIRQTKMVQTRPPAVFSQQKLYAGTPKDAALLLAGDTLITATADGKLKAGEQECSLSAPAIHDGLIAAYGRFYVTTADGAVACLGKSGGTR